MEVDVLIVCYNQEKYIRQALESVLMQRVSSDIEVRVVVADDSSTDGTIAIIHEIEKRSIFPFVYLDSLSNMGHIANYQRAFSACKGDYVCVLEGDDYWTSPYHIEKHVRCLDEHREIAMCVNKLVLYYQDDCFYHVRENINSDNLCYVTTRDHILQNRIDNHSACCYRTELLHRIPLSVMGDTFDDWLLGIFMSQFGFIGQLSEVTSVYRIHHSGVWSGQQSEAQNVQVLHNIEVADRIFEGKYHKEMMDAHAVIVDRMIGKKKYLHDYVPFFLIKLYQLVVPPVLRKKIHI